MKAMKKIICAALSLSLAAALCACGSTTTTEQTSGDDTAAEPVLIGIDQYGEHASLDNCREGFLAGLTEAGLVEGEDYTVDYQNAGFDDNINTQIASRFSSENVAMMVGIATPSAVACFNAAEDKNIPVIFTACSDPVQAKIDSGNITGTSDKLPVEAQLQLIRALQPDAKVLGIVYTTSEPNSVSTIADYEAAVADYGFTLETVGVTAQSEVTQAIDTLINRGVDCFSNLTDNNVVGVLAAILDKTNEAGIPVYGSEIEQVKIGCVASAGIDYYQLGIQTGLMAAKVLTGEATCEDIPYETISEYSTYVNSDALALMNIELPADIQENATECAGE